MRSRFVGFHLLAASTLLVLAGCGDPYEFFPEYKNANLLEAGGFELNTTNWSPGGSTDHMLLQDAGGGVRLEARNQIAYGDFSAAGAWTGAAVASGVLSQTRSQETDYGFIDLNPNLTTRIVGSTYRLLVDFRINAATDADYYFGVGFAENLNDVDINSSSDHLPWIRTDLNPNTDYRLVAASATLESDFDRFLFAASPSFELEIDTVQILQNGIENYTIQIDIPKTVQVGGQTLPLLTGGHFILHFDVQEDSTVNPDTDNRFHSPAVTVVLAAVDADGEYNSTSWVEDFDSGIDSPVIATMENPLRYFPMLALGTADTALRVRFYPFDTSAMEAGSVLLSGVKLYWHPDSL